MELAIIAAVAIIAMGFVVYPLLPGNKRELPAFSEDALNEQVARYREAIRRGTLCDRCLSANPAGSKYCGECGSRLGD